MYIKLPETNIFDHLNNNNIACAQVAIKDARKAYKEAREAISRNEGTMHTNTEDGWDNVYEFSWNEKVNGIMANRCLTICIHKQNGIFTVSPFELAI